MGQQVKSVVIIPARAGSKRLPDKNIRKLNGKPLIFHTLDKVVNAKCFDEIIFTSDSNKMNKMVKKRYKDVVIFNRPKELASDSSKVIDTISVIFDNLKLGSDDSIWLCLPTCPLKSVIDILKAYTTLYNEDCDGVLTITDFDFPPRLGFEKDKDDFIFDWHSSMPFHFGNTRSQDHPTIYRPNGAIYGMRAGKFDKYRSWYKGKIKGIYMPRERSVDIDTKLDFEIAEVVIKSKFGFCQNIINRFLKR